ncbi:MAG: hypothetical protein PHQ24_07125 [Proteiniphilum sp.]|nr:hypothetical protein [Proteiniphilum sp.]
MDFVDLLLKRFDGESELRKPTSALVCFSQPETGKMLTQLAYQIAMARSERSSIALLYFIDQHKEQLSQEGISMLQSKIGTDFMPKAEKGKLTIRTFISDEEDHTAYIEKMAEEQSANLVLRGISNEELNIVQVERYSQLRRDPTNPMPAILAQFPQEQAKILQELSMMMGQNKVPTALFIDNGLREICRIFMPVLGRSDVQTFTFLYHLSHQENAKVMVWDAIGIIEKEPKLQKLFQFIVKKSDGRVHLWNNDRKIEETFIREQDLMIIGVEGWSRLINTPLSWKEHLPSLLIIKDNQT